MSKITSNLYDDNKFIIWNNYLLKRCSRCEGDGREEINTFLSLSIPCQQCDGKGHLKIQNEITEILYGE